MGCFVGTQTDEDLGDAALWAGPSTVTEDPFIHQAVNERSASVLWANAILGSAG